MKINGFFVFMAVLFVGAIFVLGVKLLNPPSIGVFIEGNKTAISRIPGFFTLDDVMIVAVASVFFGISAMYLLFFDHARENIANESAENKKEWQDAMKILGDDERAIYEAVFDSGGAIMQRDLIGGENGFSKAKVTRCLDALENRGLIERRRKGMGNLIFLK